jgi:hypothetical protein
LLDREGGPPDVADVRVVRDPSTGSGDFNALGVGLKLNVTGSKPRCTSVVGRGFALLMVRSAGPWLT